MIKFYITIVVLFCCFSGPAQTTWSVDAIGQESSFDQFHNYITQVKSIRKLRLIAETCNADGKYEKSTMVYEYLVENFHEKINGDDVRALYTGLLKCDRFDEIPFDNLQFISADVADLLKIARVRREINDKGGENLNEYVKNLKGSNLLLYGYNLDEIGQITLYSDSLNQLFTYQYDDSELLQGEVIEHGYSKKYKVVSVEKFGGKTHMYTVFNRKLGLYRIDIVGGELPRFTHNSRFYSTGMPWFDPKTERLYFCSDDKKGYGGWDIYYSELEKKRWAEPAILDEKVNTQFDDIFPVIKDEWLLYSSEGHKGKGKLDNYALDMMNWTNYNLFDCNTSLDDFCIRLLNDSTDFFTCRQSKILRGHYDDFWSHLVKEEDVERYLFKEDSLLKRRLELFAYEKEGSIGLDLGSVEFPEIYNFDCGESVHFPFDHSDFDQSLVEYLNECVVYFSEMPRAKTILVYGSADPRGTDEYNYLLSLKRARRIITQMKSSAQKDFVYKTIVLGEELYDNDKPKVMDDYREVFFRACNFNLPYDIMIVVGKDEVLSVQELSEWYNNDLTQLTKVNDLLSTDELSDVYLVGIQTIHRVYKKETLYSLASRYSCSVNDLMKVNHKTNYNVKIGELLIIPLEE